MISTDQAVQIYQTSTGHRLSAIEWPKTLVVNDATARTAPYARFHWPFLSLQVENGRAVYRVSTCDLGFWRGTLVESWIAATVTP